MKGFILMNRIKEIVDAKGQNPHWLSRKTGVTYRVVRELYNSPQIKPTTSIGTLAAIAQVLDRTVDDLYIVQPKTN